MASCHANTKLSCTLHWGHNDHDGVSNHQPHGCLLNRLLGTDQRKHQSSASLAFVRGIHRRPVNSPHKWPVTRKMFPFDDVIMIIISPKHYIDIQRIPLFHDLIICDIHPQVASWNSDLAKLRPSISPILFFTSSLLIQYYVEYGSITAVHISLSRTSCHNDRRTRK